MVIIAGTDVILNMYPNEQLEVSPGTLVDVTCSGTGDPQPEVTWYQDGLLIEQTGDRLQFVATRPTEFECVAENQYDKDSDKLIVIVNGNQYRV